MEKKYNHNRQNKSNAQPRPGRHTHFAGQKSNSRSTNNDGKENRTSFKFKKTENDQPEYLAARHSHHGKSHSQRHYDPNANKKRGSDSVIARERKRKNILSNKREETLLPTHKSNSGTTRLNKYIANAGICSRREADKLITAGSISVNGKVVTEMGFQVHEGDVVNYGGEVLHSERKRYFLLNKPKGFITTVDDPQNRETVMMLIDGACPERIYPVGRLDRNTTGLLLFTNDGALARRLTHPSTGVYKIYQVELDKPVTRNDMQQMREGIELEDGPIRVDDVQYIQGANDKRIVGIELHSGKNRIVRRIFEHLGYNVHKLDRVVFAGLTKKDLPRGHYRELTEKEVGYLMMI